MPSYDIRFKTSARRELTALGDSITLRVLEKIEHWLTSQDRMVARSCAAPRISGEYESVTTESFKALMIALQKSRSFEFAIGGKSMTNLDRNGPAKSWMWSGGPLQTRPYDLDGRQTSYPYTSSGTLAKTYRYDGPRPPGELDRLASYSNEVYAYDGPRPVASLPGGLGPGLPRADSNRSSHTVHTSGALITETIYLNDTPIAAIKAAGAYLIQADHLNTPRAMLAASNGARPSVSKRLVACVDSKKQITGATAIP